VKEKIEGSVRLEEALAQGCVIGTPDYADYIPHHVRHAAGAWTYENVYDPKEEKLRISLIEKKKDVEFIAYAVEVIKIPEHIEDKLRYAEENYNELPKTLFLRRLAGNIYEDIPMPAHVTISAYMDEESIDHNANVKYEYFDAEFYLIK